MSDQSKIGRDENYVSKTFPDDSETQSVMEKDYNVTDVTKYCYLRQAFMSTNIDTVTFVTKYSPTWSNSRNTEGLVPEHQRNLEYITIPLK